MVAADGLNLFYRTDLPTDQPDDPRGAVMLLHGLGEHSGRYEHVIDALTSDGFAVIAPDHRGHGRSEGSRAVVRNYDEFMADISQLRGIVDTEFAGLPLVVLGHSMGGNLALGHVLRAPTGVAGLALSGPLLLAGDDVKPIELKILSVVGRVAPGFRPRGLDAAAISRDPAVVADYRADPLVWNGKISAGIAAALFGEMSTFPNRYRELELPVLVMHGTADRLTNIEGSRQLAAAATNADVTTHFYDGLYHEIFNEPERDAVIGDLRAWLDATVSGAVRS